MPKATKKKAVKKSVAFVRINSRITTSQHKYIKLQANKNKCTEGEILRGIVQSYIDNI